MNTEEIVLFNDYLYSVFMDNSIDMNYKKQLLKIIIDINLFRDLLLVFLTGTSSQHLRQKESIYGKQLKKLFNDLFQFLSIEESDEEKNKLKLFILRRVLHNVDILRTKHKLKMLLAMKWLFPNHVYEVIMGTRRNKQWLSKTISAFYAYVNRMYFFIVRKHLLQDKIRRNKYTMN